MNKITLIALTVVSLSISPLMGQEKTVTYLYDGGNRPGERTIDIRHVETHLQIDPHAGSFEGTATYEFRFLSADNDSVLFYTPSMDILSASIGMEECRFRQTGKHTVIYTDNHPETGRTMELSISYGSHPSLHCNVIGWDDTTGIKRKQIWAHRPFGWIPYLEDRLTADLFVTFDSACKVFSNGKRISVGNNEDGTNTWHYRMEKEHPFFSTCLVIGDYDYENLETERGLPVELWYYPEWKERFGAAYRYMTDMFDFFEKEFGMDYPYGLYRQAPVTDYTYGAMETTTATVFGDYLFVGPRAFYMRNYINVNAHELAHQWFGNCISHLRPSDVWLTESFATYYAKMFEKEIYGPDHYQKIRVDEWKETMEASKKNSYPVGHSRGGRARWYPKGSLVMDMLRYVMGEADFLSSISHYMNSHAFGSAESLDFLRAIHEATGKDMTWFFDQWICRGGEPHYEVSYRVVDDAEDNRFTEIMVSQIHPTNELIGLFEMPVVLEVHYPDHTYDSVRVWIKKRDEQIMIPNPQKKEVAFVLFDPGDQILKNLTFKKDLEELSTQAMYAPGMIDRHAAVSDLRGFPPGKKRSLLHQRYEQESFHLIKSEIISQLAGDTASANLIREAIYDPDALVRRAVVEHMREIPEALRPDYEVMLEDSCYRNLELALENLCRSFPGEKERYLMITENETGWRGRNIRMKWLEIAIESGKKEFLQELVAYAGNSYEFETRKNALNTLQRLNFLNEAAVNHLFDACLYFNFRLSQSAKENLVYLYQQNQHRVLIDSLLTQPHRNKEEINEIRKILDKKFDL